MRTAIDADFDMVEVVAGQIRLRADGVERKHLGLFASSDRDMQRVVDFASEAATNQNWILGQQPANDLPTLFHQVAERFVMQGLVNKPDFTPASPRVFASMTRPERSHYVRLLFSNLER